jgi:hypothetical protein
MPKVVQRAPTHPFLAAAQRDFASRLRWATTANFQQANHSGPHTMLAKPGERVSIRAKASDPDGNAVTLKWFVVPLDAKPDDTIQIIAEATDNGTPALTHYAKAVITVAQ